MPQFRLRLTAVLAHSGQFSLCSSFHDRSRAIIQTTFRNFLDVGSCRNCQIVDSLGEVVLTGTPTIWAIGYYFPTEGQGAGDNSVVRSFDSGRHWVEIPKSRMHATEPSISFLDSKTGWISGMSPDATSWVLRTNDGGRHWTQVSDHFIQDMQFLNEKVAVGDEFDGTASRFAKTIDGGHTWMISALPGPEVHQQGTLPQPGGWLDRWNE